MDELSDLLSLIETLPGLALVAVILTFAVLNPGFHLIWFGLSAVVVGLVSLAANIAWQLQLVAFVLIALAAFFFMRKKGVSDAYTGDAGTVTGGGLHHVGRVVTVEDAITNGRGSVRVDDRVWPATGENVPKNARVKVTGVDGGALVVVRVAG